jgi:hypothetical protein
MPFEVFAELNAKKKQRLQNPVKQFVFVWLGQPNAWG